MKRKIKIAKNVAKVPERRTKMRRKKERQEVQAGGFADGKFSFSDGVCVVHVAIRFGERFWEDSKVSNGFTKKVSKGVAQ